MRIGTRLLTLAAVAVALPGALVPPGCGYDDGIGKRFAVSGRVTYNGQPVKTGSVNFYPEDPNTARPAVGEIQQDGSYRLTTQTPGDGAMGGKYKVAISAYDVDTSKTAPLTGGVPDQAAVAQAPRKSLIPIKYSGTDESGLTATIGPNSTNTFNFDLKD
jgi:hypothetical protein